jgi:hypothetical protein
MGSNSKPAPKGASTVVGRGTDNIDSESEKFTPEEAGTYEDLGNAQSTLDMSAIAAAKVGGMSKLDAQLTLQDLGKEIDNSNEDVNDELNQKLDILLGKR